MTKRINQVAFICALIFSATVVITHLVKTELNWLSDTLSRYAIGDNGLIITIGFYCIGLTQVLLAISFKRAAGVAINKGPWLLCGAGLGVFIVALFPTQPPSADMLTRLPHIAGASAHFLLFPLAVLVLTPSLKVGHLKKYSFITGYVCLFFFVLLMVLFLMKPWVDIHFFGLLEKINIVMINAWLIVFSYNNDWYRAEE